MRNLNSGYEVQGVSEVPGLKLELQTVMEPIVKLIKLIEGK